MVVGAKFSPKVACHCGEFGFGNRRQDSLLDF
jgi:hypothetical protein